MGMLALLNEECKFTRATDSSLLDKLYKNLAKFRHFKVPTIKAPNFMVIHYASEVTYDIAGFLEKNRDALPPAVSVALVITRYFYLSSYSY
jgi:myosin heavy subunit